MAVLLRCAGIPARYVEGYALSSRPKSGTIYTVTNDKAHAWVEVYFEGVGWIPFEPTSSFGNSFYGNRTSASGKSPYSKFGDGRDPNRTRPSIPELNGDGTNQNQYQTYAKAKMISGVAIIIMAICVIVLITAVIIL
jgi:transglutaminase-like putative cysteine protease